MSLTIRDIALEGNMSTLTNWWNQDFSHLDSQNLSFT